MDLKEECQKAIDCGMSMRFLARKIGHDHSTLSKWLHGERNISNEIQNKLIIVLRNLKEQWDNIKV